jgi:hypothetical protein
MNWNREISPKETRFLTPSQAARNRPKKRIKVVEERKFTQTAFDVGHYRPPRW